MFTPIVVKMFPVFIARSFLKYMRSFKRKSARGFTLIELLVVLAIIGSMMMLAKNVLVSPGKDQRINSAVNIVSTAIAEARATAIGNDTCTRIVFICDKDEKLPKSYHLRKIVVQKFEHELSRNKKGTVELYDGTKVDRDGEWRDVGNEGFLLPEGVFFSPDYSSELSWVKAGNNPMDETEIDVVVREGKKNVRETVMGFCYEFDEKGRYVTPYTKPGNPTCPRRLVLVGGRMYSGELIPSVTDDSGRPAEVGGLVIWPSGAYSMMRTPQQVYDPNLGKDKHKKSSAKPKAKKSKKPAKQDKKKQDSKK